ncbi:MAG: aminotransferase class I/II-fold pyridoxal phosphate-dependent enzyme [Actinomycetota bacterium]
MDRLNNETQAAIAGREQAGGSLAPPLWATTAFSSTDPTEAACSAGSTRPSRFYTRYGNPTINAFEEAVAALEGAEAALAFGSGMGAVASTVMALCSQGDHIVAQRQLYGGTLFFLQTVCPRFGIDVTLVDATEPGAFREAVRPGRTMLVLAETPSNPRLALADLEELGSLSGPFTVVDSTFATPMIQRPLEFGVSLVLHSATKAIAGHNDATLGVIAGESDLIDAVWAYSTLHGSVASPFDSWNALRGIRTLGVRVERSSRTALALARFLEAHPAVASVSYPGLDSHPQRELAARQMSAGGGMLSFELRDADRAHGVLEALQLVRVATSLGGPDTLMCHPASTTHAGLAADLQQSIGVTTGLLRVSVGLEHLDDLVLDLHTALA